MRFRFKQHFQAGLALTLLATALIGCGSRTGLNLGRVSGRVTHEGEPVRNGTVIFQPDEDQGTTGPTAMGIIDKDGNFTLTTSDPRDGAVVGTHQVGIVGLDAEPLSGEGQEPPPDPSADSLGYLKGKAAASQKARQKPSPDEEDTFTDRGGTTYRYIIPKELGDPRTSGITVEVSGWSNEFHFNVAEDGTVSIEE